MKRFGIKKISLMVLIFSLVFQMGFSSVILAAENNSNETMPASRKNSHLLETSDYGEIRDTMSDTWVGVDDLGRLVPVAGEDEVGEPEEEKHILMFYYTWCMPQHVQAIYNNVSIIEKGLEKGRWRWGPTPMFHYAMEPYFGFYRSTDPWVIRKDIQMLCDAGVDGVFFDAGNGYLYYEAYEAFFKENLKRKEEGQSYLKVTWMLKAKGPEQHVSRVLEKLYKQYYTKEKYQDIFYTINGKPLMLCPKEAILDEFANFFEVRECWAWESGEGKWPWLENSPQIGGWDWGSRESAREMVSVAAAQHSTSNMGKSFSNGRQPSMDKLKTNEGPYFTEQWERALELDPQFVLVTQWNEWIAQRFVSENANPGLYFLGETVPAGGTYFVDTATPEYSRDIAPMKGGYGDNYYYQLVSYARKFLGARKIPTYTKQGTVDIKDFSTIKNSESVYYDDLYDTMHRDHPGSVNSSNKKYYYTDDSGRNDFEEVRVLSDNDNLYFYVRTVEDITAPEGTNWMNLLLNVDANYDTGWHGYDYIVNRSPNGNVTTIEKYGAGGKYSFKSVGEAAINYSGKEMVISVPKKLVSLMGDELRVDFKFADNIPEEDDIMLFIDKGDVAPNNRFNYRYEFAEDGKADNVLKAVIDNDVDDEPDEDEIIDSDDETNNNTDDDSKDESNDNSNDDSKGENDNEPNNDANDENNDEPNKDETDDSKGDSDEDVNNESNDSEATSPNGGADEPDNTTEDKGMSVAVIVVLIACGVVVAGCVVFIVIFLNKKK